MPIDPEEFLAEGRAYADTIRTARRNGNGALPHGDEEESFAGLFRRVPEGARNTTLTRLVGYLRAKRLDYPAGLFIARQWSREFCDPPMDETEVEALTARAWAEWTAGTLPDATPEEFRGDVTVPKSAPLTVAELYDIADDPARALKWLADDLIQEDGVTIISGPPGNGKTWLVLDMCRHLTRAEGVETGQWLGTYDLPRKGVLYMDEENGERTMAKRVKLLDFSRENERFLCWSDSKLRLSAAADRRTVIDYCAGRDISVLVMDSLKAFHGLDENSATEMRRVGEWLREFVLAGLTVIVLHHDKKGNAETAEQDRTRGSGDITAFAQTVLGLVQAGRVFKVSKRKVRNAENDRQVLTYTLTARSDETLFLDAQTGAALDAEERAVRRDAALQRKVERVAEAITILESRGAEVTARAIQEIAKMKMADVIEARNIIEDEG